MAACTCTSPEVLAMAASNQQNAHKCVSFNILLDVLHVFETIPDIHVCTVGILIIAGKRQPVDERFDLHVAYSAFQDLSKVDLLLHHGTNVPASKPH